MKFDEAKAAHEAGQKVEFRWKSSHGENPWMLVKALFGPQNREEDIRSTYEFRLAPGQEPEAQTSDDILTYEQADKAFREGKKVQARGMPHMPWLTCDASDQYPDPIAATAAFNSMAQFRLAPGQEPDPYAEYKAAQKAGKVIQVDVSPDNSGDWQDEEEPELLSYCYPPHCYRVKPEPALVIEPGKERPSL